MTTLLFTACVISLLAKVRWKSTPEGATLLQCGQCGYDLQGIGETAVCPECGTAERARTERRRVWVFVPARSPIVVVWFLVLAVPVLLKTGQSVGAWKHYLAFEPSAAAWHNGSIGAWDAAMNPSTTMTVAIALIAVSTIWWRPVVSVPLAVVLLMLLCLLAYQDGFARPWAARADSHDTHSGIAATLAAGTFALSLLCRVTWAAAIWAKSRFCDPIRR